jgi:hypothetical protein
MSKEVVVSYLMKISTALLRVCEEGGNKRNSRVAALCLVPPVNTRASTAINSEM